MMSIRRSVLLACLLGLAGCGGDEPAACGASAACICQDGSHGAQVCEPDETFAPCQCDDATVDAGVDADANAALDAAASDAANARDDASAGCDLVIPACNYFELAHPETATQQDIDSRRRTNGYWCYQASTGNTWMNVEDCSLGETCEYAPETPEVLPACVSCGSDAAQVAYRTIDGEVAEDCRGCTCYGWAVYGCFAAGVGQYDEPWIDLVWQDGADVMRFDIAADNGAILYDHAGGSIGPGVSVNVATAEISPGGTIELDITVSTSVPDASGAHAWYLHGHVVDECP